MIVLLFMLAVIVIGIAMLPQAIAVVGGALPALVSSVRDHGATMPAGPNIVTGVPVAPRLTAFGVPSAGRGVRGATRSVFGNPTSGSIGRGT